MRKLSKCIGVKTEGEPIVWHAVVSDLFGSTDTLCGLSFAEGSDAHELVPAKRGQKIACRRCWNAWLQARRFKITDFDGSL